MNLDKLEIFYIENHKKLMWIPIIVTILALLFIGSGYSKTGDFFEKDVSLKGGISATITTDREIDIVELEKAIPKQAAVRKLTDTLTQKQVGISIQVSDMTEQELKVVLIEFLGIELNEENFSISETGSVLGETFYKDLMKALAFAFILMGITVTILFRKAIPSIGVIFAAFADIVITLAIINLIGLRISTAGIVAFLLLIGYSVDSDILLTTRALKRKEGSLFSQMYRAASTGITMTVATITVVVIGFILTSNPTLREMFLILAIGLIVDLFTTYFTNSGILYLYLTKK